VRFLKSDFDASLNRLAEVAGLTGLDAVVGEDGPDFIYLRIKAQIDQRRITARAGSLDRE
jgi:hypothetical protein